ncbi:coiled-coil domain-containing protein 170 isoform X1 [Stegostoma tigrinum]|uniref:coiled-coil domain-containing protein 170 isoform X1 n=1 Tax=Stegostoma tigrinum TaxID=3053191 RepID=UPI002870AB8C|nr:coiled-coil domain-containing protein 170 isoform X1 [Stegostoma tigrinum]
MSGCKGADSGSPAPELIDVNSNRALRSLGRLSSSPAAGHRVPELQEQLNAMKRQLTEKEELIAILSGGRSRSRLDSQKGIFEPMVEIPVLREQLNHYRVASETARSELAALQVKYKSSQTELTDTCMKLASQEGYVQELKAEVERYKMENTRQQSLIVCLRERILESEEKSGTLLSSKTEAEVTLQVLQNENRELQQRNTELESKLRKYLTEWDEVKREDTRRVKEHDEFLEKLARAINVDSRGTEHHLDLLLSQVGDLYRENTRKIIQIRSLEETVGAHDMESKASRETIMRLVSELGREQKAVASYVQELGTIRKELDNALNSKHHLERENRSLQDRLDSTQRALEASKLETRSWEQRSKELDGSLLTSVCEAKSVHTQLEAFKHQLVSLLSKTDVIVPPTEEAIKERIHEVCNSEENSKQTVPQLEENVTKLTLQLEKQVDLHQAALQRCIKAEQELSELQEKVRFLEGNLLTGDVMCDTLSQDKQKYLKFLEDIAERMKLERVTAEIGFDMQLDAILARADQLVKMENEAIIENKTVVYNLKRKLKAQKDELVSKELHMDLLRRKITQLDAEKQTQTALAVERDEANLTVRKLKKKVERLEKELVTARTSSLDLKAKLSDTQELKIKTLEQSKTIGELNKSMKKLEKLKETAVEKLNTTKSELDLTELEAKEEKERARNILEAVGSELKTLKQTLQEVARRERQLLDFREVVSRILGLNIDALALPDYEIVKRLEKLAQAHRTSAMTALCLENSMGKLHQGYLAGCEARQRLASSLNHPGCKPVPALPARRPKSSS